MKKLISLFALLPLALSAAVPSFQDVTNICNAQLTKGTNYPAFFLAETNLNNAQWIQNQAGKLQDFNNYNQFNWKKVASKIANRQTFKIELDGTGLVGQGILNGVFYNITNNFTLAGFQSQFYPFIYDDYRNGTAYASTGKDTNWFAGYEVTLASNDSFQVVSTYKWNVAEVDYVAFANGGSFTIETNFVLAATVNSSNNTPVGRSIFITNSTPSISVIRITQTSPAGKSNIVVNVGTWDTTIPAGVIVGQQENYSSFVTNELTCLPSIRTPIYQTWNPDLIIWQDIESTNALFTTNLPLWLSFYTNACPNADVVLCGTYPVPADINDIYGQNLIIRSNAVNFSMSYFDGWHPFEDFTNVVVPRGLGILNDVHYTAQGYAAYGYFLTRWMNLASAQSLYYSNAASSYVFNPSDFTVTGSNIRASTNLARTSVAQYFEINGDSYISTPNAGNGGYTLTNWFAMHPAVFFYPTNSIAKNIWVSAPANITVGASNYVFSAYIWSTNIATYVSYLSASFINNSVGHASAVTTAALQSTNTLAVGLNRISWTNAFPSTNCSAAFNWTHFYNQTNTPPIWVERYSVSTF